jgi:hypothetical protein
MQEPKVKESYKPGNHNNIVGIPTIVALSVATLGFLGVLFTAAKIVQALKGIPEPK